MDYLDFAIEVHTYTDGHYVVAVRSPAGEARTTAPFPFTDAALESHLLKVENAILRSAGRRRKAPTPEEEAVQGFGRELFGFLLRDELLSRFRACQQLAHDQSKGVRIKLSVTPPALAGLPWEFLYDPARRDYLCLDANTPLVRYPELPLTIQPLPVTPPLRILGLCVDASDLTRLDVAEEKARMAAAVQTLQAQGLVELTWLDGQTADDLQRAMRRGPWHILHYIGHGSFDQVRDEGLIHLTDATGKAAPLYATQLARLLARQRHDLRLVLLNACEGARGGRLDLFAGTAATLVGSGIPAVLAMQYEITDDAAIAFARTFYEALADNLPVDTAVADARNAMTLRNRFSLEWGTPVLYLRAPDGRLFDFKGQTMVEPIPLQPLAQRDVAAKQFEPTLNALIKADHSSNIHYSRRHTLIYFDWVTIPAGEFLMGSNIDEDPDTEGDELPQHKLYLPEYQISRVPVTVAQFEQFIKATGYQTTAERQGSASVWNDFEWNDVWGANWEYPLGLGSDVKSKVDHPVTCVSWFDTQEFCRWANVRLPSEAEWEKAARSSDGRIYPWGNELQDDEYCNFDMNINDTTPVNKYHKGASFYGVLDMAGNVWEWTSSQWGWDWKKPDFGYPYNPHDGREDLHTAGFYVLRGGSFNLGPNLVRSAFRNWNAPNARRSNTGFRVARVETARDL